MSERILPRDNPPKRSAARLAAATLAAMRELDSCSTLADFGRLSGYRKRRPVLLRLAGRGQHREVVL